jgi:hypothetical protein
VKHARPGERPLMPRSACSADVSAIGTRGAMPQGRIIRVQSWYRKLGNRVGDLPTDRAVFLVIVSFLAIAFFLGAVLVLAQSAISSATDSTVSGVVRSCVGEDTRTPVCTVEITSPSSRTGLRKVVSTGPLDGLAPGRTTSLWLSRDGTADIAGWRGWANGLGLGLVALIVVGVAIAAWSSAMRASGLAG